MLELLIEGRLPLRADGDLQLPKQPPFDVLTPGWAALVTVELDDLSPDCIRLFDTWYRSEDFLDVIVFDGKATRIQGAMECIGMEHHQGIEITRAWSEPLRRATVERNGRQLSAIYRPTPRFQSITKPVHSYQLAAQRYGFIGRAAA